MILIQAEKASQVKYYMETKIHLQEALESLELIVGKALMSEKICLIYVKFRLDTRALAQATWQCGMIGPRTTEVRLAAGLKLRSAAHTACRLTLDAVG